MAAPSQPSEFFLSVDEAEDIANALAASLDTAQVAPQHVHSAGNWVPMTAEQQRTQLRQKEALDDAVAHKEFPDLSKAIRESLEAANRTQTAPAIAASSELTNEIRRTQTADTENRASSPTVAISSNIR